MHKEICEHSVDVDLIKPGAKVLDIGCRGFGFTNAMTALGCQVHAIDPDTLDGGVYHKCAISTYDGTCDLVHTNDPQGKYIKSGNVIPVFTLKSFSEKVGVKWWDLIKIDCEGEEYAILPTLTEPIATQLSIEFHEHTAKKIGQSEIDNMLARFEQWYDIRHKVWESRHGAGFNYWDVLLVLKGAK
jgi:FkbM family methyltransferase